MAPIAGVLKSDTGAATVGCFRTANVGFLLASPKCGSRMFGEEDSFQAKGLPSPDAVRRSIF